MCPFHLEYDEPSGSEGGAVSDQNQSSDQKQEAKARAQDAKERVQDKAEQARREATQQAEAEAKKRKSQVVTQVNNVAQALRRASEQLREDNQNDLAGYTEEAANRVESVSSYLDEQGVRGLAQDVEQFARKQPGLFIGGAVALGVVGARFLKSSRPEGSGSYDDSSYGDH